jgi:hypothetical protein
MTGRNRFVNLYGMPHTRLYRNDRLYQNRRSARSLFVNIMSALLLFAPEAHLKALNEVTVDGVVSVTYLKPLLAKLNQEWRDLLLLVSACCTFRTPQLIIKAWPGGSTPGCQRFFPRYPRYRHRHTSSTSELRFDYIDHVLPDYWFPTFIP